MKIFLAYLSIFAILLSSCTKEEKDKSRVVKGKIVRDCFGTPYPNLKLNLNGSRNYFQKPVSATTRTDENGVYEIRYEGPISELILNSGAPIMDRIPGHLDYVDVGEIIQGMGIGNFVIKLEVKNPYTEQDTLFYNRFRMPLNDETIGMLIGPFSDCILDTVRDFPLLPGISYGENDLKFLNMIYHLGEKKYYSRNFSFVIPRCGEMGEVTIVLD
jgi:hypothetical protein